MGRELEKREVRSGEEDEGIQTAGRFLEGSV